MPDNLQERQFPDGTPWPEMAVWAYEGQPGQGKYAVMPSGSVLKHKANGWEFSYSVPSPFVQHILSLTSENQKLKEENERLRGELSSVCDAYQDTQSWENMDAAFASASHERFEAALQSAVAMNELRALSTDAQEVKGG